jgi:hypothetical protein
MGKKKAKRKAEPESDNKQPPQNVAKDIEDIFAERKSPVKPSAKGDDDGESQLSPSSNSKTSNDVVAAIGTKVKTAKASSIPPQPRPLKQDEFSDLRGTKKRILLPSPVLRK